MGNRLDNLKKRYDDYIKAEDAILNGAQEYGMGTRNLKRADLNSISEMIKYLEKEIEIEESKQQGRGRNKVVGVIPRDL